MTDIAQLGFRVDSAQVLTATEALDQMGDQAERTERQLRRSATEGARGFQAMSAPIDRAASSMLASAGAADVLGHSMRASSAHTTNLMFQFQDIGMMLAAGQSPLMLAMQQGTQVAGVFEQMKNSGQSAFSGIIGGLRALVSPMSLLTVGVIAGGAALAQWAMRAISAGDAASSYEEALEALNEEIRDSQTELLRLQEGLDTVAQAMQLEAIRELERELAAVNEQIREYTSQIPSGTPESLSAFAGVLANLREQRAEIQGMISEGQERIEQAQELEDRIEAAKDAGVDLSAVFDAMDLSPVIAQAGALAQQLWNATAAARAVMEQAVAGRLAEQEAMRYSGRGGGAQYDDFRAQNGMYVPSAGAVEGADALMRPIRARRSGGGGGVARVPEEVLESQRKAERVMRDVQRATLDAMSAAERYNHELQEVRELHEEGYLTAEQYARAVGMIDQEMQEAQLEPFRRGIESISDAIADAIINGEDMREAFSRILAQIASDILSSGINDLLSNLFKPSGGGGGGIFGGLFSGIFGIGKNAQGTDYWRGGLSWVGEQGPEIVNLPRGSQVIPNHKLNSMGGGDVHVHHHWNIAANGDESVKRIVRDQAPAIVEASKNAVLDAKRRGGNYAQAF